MIVDLDYIAQVKPKILSLSLATKRDIKALHLSSADADRAKSDPIWCLVLSQGPNANYCDHCFIWWSQLEQVIHRGAPTPSIDREAV
jgi:hypothetical protein